MSKTADKFSPEVRVRAVRMVLDHQGEYCSRWAAVSFIAAKIGCAAQTLNEWVKKAEVDDGSRTGLPADVADKMKALKRENLEFCQANEILHKETAYLAIAEFDRPPQTMISFIDEHRGVFGVEPICKLLPIAPSTYYGNAAKRMDVDRLSVRAHSDISLKIERCRIFELSFRVYGVRKVWRQLKREGFVIALGNVARLMRSMSLQGIIRGKPIRTTFSDKTGRAH
ncbi:Transposase [compost metagenome]